MTDEGLLTSIEALGRAAEIVGKQGEMLERASYNGQLEYHLFGRGLGQDAEAKATPCCRAQDELLRLLVRKRRGTAARRVVAA